VNRLKNKIGIGIVTCNRKDFFNQLIKSIPDVDNIVVVNDGNPYDEYFYTSKVLELIQHKRNKGIAKSKNDALKYLAGQNCEHIFLLEDDIAINDQSVFESYIQASRVSGILHFNYAYHGKWNKDKNGKPTPRVVKNYADGVKIAFHSDLTGALSYFRKSVLESVGFMDENYINVLEHVDHTYRITQKGYHPPFRWFADIESSFDSIRELDPVLEESVNSRHIISTRMRARIFGAYFRLKHGYRPHLVPTVDEKELLNILDDIKSKFADS